MKQKQNESLFYVQLIHDAFFGKQNLFTEFSWLSIACENLLKHIWF